jgi:nicotinate-nucleotide pyrophosphorylase (carboxylating)
MQFGYNESLEQARAQNVNDALMDGIGRGDWTAMRAAPDRQASARVVAMDPAVLCEHASEAG